MTQQEPPKITFPCPNYPIKIMGEASVDFKDRMLTVVVKHAPDYDTSQVVVHDSRNGRFQSVNVAITATSEAQLVALFEDLKKHKDVRMVL